ncbi:MAG TPA: trehalose-phosphatase [Thermoleophilia bacterium]|nr:trehalose-phosphatase [Thermoleophilia bacterium]
MPTILAGEDAMQACLAAVRRAPRATALFCDIDGTIAPIVGHPADAVVPTRFKTLLRALVTRLGSVAFVTGRALDDGRRMVAVEGAAYVGTHGLQILTADGSSFTEPQAERYIDVVQRIAALAAEELADLDGVVLEDKRTVLAIHYRLAPDADRARHEIVARVVEPARAAGLAISTGHFVYEIRPPVPVTKGTATRRLLAGRDLVTAVFCGDDLTDVTGFEAVHRWAEADARRYACAVAAVTAETPPPVTEAADVQVAATEGMYEFLSRLLAAAGG